MNTGNRINYNKHNIAFLFQILSPYLTLRFVKPHPNPSPLNPPHPNPSPKGEGLKS